MTASRCVGQVRHTDSVSSKSKSKPKPKTKAPKAPDPDRLIRNEDGAYRSEDERFEVRDGGTGWFVSDAEQANDFGQELIVGPYPTLKAARAALPDLRAAKIVPLRRSPQPAQKAGPKPKRPKSWIDELSKADAATVRGLVAALAHKGISDADALVRRDREGMLPAIATRLIERDLDGLADQLPEPAREGARQLIHRAAEIITASGANPSKGLPGWSLVELGPESEPPNRRIVIR